MTESEKQKLDTISSLLSEAGYDPYDQLSGYVLTGEVTYITRNGNARKLIETIDSKTISEYLKTLKALN